MRQSRAAVAIGMLACVVWACSLGFGMPVVENPSFEQDTFTEWPGYSAFGSLPDNGPITGWTTSDPTRTGLNPISDGQKPFADNGAIPSSLDIGVSPNPTTGGQIAFIQATTRTSLSQAISGFDPNASYVIEYRENARNTSQGAISLDVTLSGQVIDLVPDHTVRAVGGSDPYHYIRSRVFRPTSSTETLSFSAWSGADNTALLDNVQITQITEHPATVLFQDTFSDEYFLPDNNDLNSQRPGTRQSGTLGSLPYLELTGSAGGHDWRTQLDNPGRPDAVLLAPGFGGGSYYASVWMSPDHDFVEAPAAGRQVVEVSLDPAARDWMGLVFGTDRPDPNRSPSQTIANNSNGYGFLLYYDGSWELYDRSTLVDQGSVLAHAGYYDVRAELDLADFNDGSPLGVKVYVDDLLAAEYGGTAHGHNYILLEGYGGLTDQLTVSWVDNLLVYNIDQIIPEPCTLGLLAFGLLGLRARKRRTRP